MSDRHCAENDPCLPCRAHSDSYASPATDDRVALERIGRDLLISTDFHSPATVMLGLVDAALAAGWRSPLRVIEAAEELDALPDRSIVRTRWGTAVQKNEELWEFPNQVGQFTGDAFRDDLPVTVLWTPEADR